MGGRGVGWGRGGGGGGGGVGGGGGGWGGGGGERGPLTISPGTSSSAARAGRSHIFTDVYDTCSMRHRVVEIEQLLEYLFSTDPL